MTDVDYTGMSPKTFRALCRKGRFDGPTAGVAMNHAQMNLVVLPAAHADDFANFCRLNPKACPLQEQTAPGHYEPVNLARGADLRTDLPRYRVFRKGKCVKRPTSIKSLWPDVDGPAPCDLVAFLIGCSFTFEAALLAAELPVRHLEERKNVPMYRTRIYCKPSGPFAGPLIVSMRPMSLAQAETAIRVTVRFPGAHGGPVHIGDPRVIGITDLDQPDYGDRVTIRPDEVPVYWACGVTPIEAILQARPELAITHEPGHMFVSDLPISAFYDRSSLSEAD